VWPEVGIVEVLRMDDDRPAAPGEAGRLVCTGLLNAAMPLVRYEVGDVGSIREGPAACACGRTLPVLESLEGRIDDVVTTADGRRIGRLDPVFKADLKIREAQIVQETPDRIRVRIVKGEGFGEGDARALVERLEERVGKIAVTLDYVEAIPRSANGKFKAVVSMVGKPPG
jgi:phenylacetate-CoA ligase